MKNNTPNTEADRDVAVISSELNTAMKLVEKDEVVIYDECGDTLWDRVLRQEESKQQLSNHVATGKLN